MTKKNKPGIRFPGFTEEWEQRKFNNLVVRVNKITNSNSLPKIEFEDILAGEGRLNKDVSQKFDNRKGVEFLPNDILYGKLRPYLKNWLKPSFTGVALGDFWVFRVIKSDSDFIYSLIQSDKYQRVANDTSGTKMPRSDWKKVSETEFLVPDNRNEQQKIGTFFKQLDDTIALHQRELELLKETKKGFLQKMFPKEGEKVPEIRFPGFTEDWEQRKLGDEVHDIGTGRSSFTFGIEKSSDNPYAVLGSTSVISYDREFDYSGDFVLTARVGANAGTLYKYSGDAKISDNTVYIQSLNLDFVYYILTNFDLKRLSFGTGQPLVKASELKNLKIMFPKDEDEQQKIGTFFKQLDDTIALHQRELDLLKETKKGFLQKLFV